MDCGKVDFSKLYLMTEKKGYRIVYNMSKLQIKTPMVFSPFGIENYNGKDILNLEVKNIGNDQANFVHVMSTFDRLYHHFSDKSIINDTNKVPFINVQQYAILSKDLCGKTYTTFLKHGTQGKHVRTHLTKNTEIYKIVNGKKLPTTEIKGKKLVCEIELANLWVYGVSYGLTWNINKIEVL